MYCAKCGKKIRENQKFCDGCGAKNSNFKPENSIQKIVKNAIAGDEEALEQIYDMTYRQAFSVALQIVKNEQDAQDVLQDAYLSAFRNLNRLENPEKLKSWFNSIVANRCKDWLRKKKPQLFTDISIGDETGEEFENSIKDERDTFSPEDNIDYSETKRLMQEILDNLPEDQKLCVLMYYYEEFSIKEIAEVLECSEGTVKSRLNYARKKIKGEVEELERRGTKLYSIAPIPFILWMLRTEEKGISVPKDFTLSLFEKFEKIQSVNNTGKRVATAKNGKETVKAVEKEVIKNAGVVAKKSTRKIVATKIIAGVVGASVLSGGVFGGYKAYEYVTKETDKTANMKIEKKLIEKKEEPKEEPIEEFELNNEEIAEITNANIWFDAVQREKDGYQNRQDYILELSDNKIPKDILQYVANEIVCRDESIGTDAGSNAVEAKETLSATECKVFLKDTFDYEVKNSKDIKEIFEEVDDDIYMFRLGDDSTNDTIYETNKFAQTGKDEYHFYTDVKQHEEYNDKYIGTIDATAHRNKNSQIAGFVFDKIEFIAGDSSIEEEVEFSVLNMVRVKAEESGQNNDYVPSGEYDVNSLSNKEFVRYANMMMTCTSSIIKESESVYSEETYEGYGSMFEGYAIAKEKYDDFCRNTLGRTEKYDINEINKVDGEKVNYGYGPLDAWFLVDNAQIFQNADGSVKMRGTLSWYSVGGEQGKEFEASGYAEELSATGVVINKVEIVE